MRICNLLSKGRYPCILSALFLISIAFKLDCRAIPILGVVMLLRLLVLTIFQLMTHDFQDHNDACLIMIVCYLCYLLNHSISGSSFDILTMINSFCSWINLYLFVSHAIWFLMINLCASMTVLF
jgi:hypothetical protein